MGEFIRFYSWGLSMKFHMAVYTLALVFFKAIFNALAGEGSVSSLTMLQMLLVSMAVAILESFLFPEGRELEPSALRVRTVWWGLLCNLGFVGGSAGPGLVFQCAALGRHLPGALPGVGLVRHVVRPPCGPAAGHPLPEPEAERVPEAGTGELEKKEDGCPLGETSVLFFLIRSL